MRAHGGGVRGLSYDPDEVERTAQLWPALPSNLAERRQVEVEQSDRGLPVIAQQSESIEDQPTSQIRNPRGNA